MAQYFFDTSALAKAYRDEPGASDVRLLLADPDSQFLISSLTTVEFQSVFAQKVRARQLTEDDFRLIQRKFGGDVRARRLIVKGLLRRHQREAERLIATHAPVRKLRTLDALQLAMAIDLQSNGAADCFVLADRDLAAVARLEGISVFEPSAT